MEEKKQNQKNFGIDIDEVIAKFIVGLNSYYNERFGANFRYEDYIHYDLEMIWGGTKKRAITIVEDFYHTQNFLDIIPIEDSQEAIKKISVIFPRIIAITSRPEFTRTSTSFWIRKYFEDTIDDVVFNGQYSLSSSSNLSKIEQCLSNNIGIFVDDNLNVAENLMQAEIKSYLLTKPWNKRFVTKKSIRVENWKKILDDLKILN